MDKYSKMVKVILEKIAESDEHKRLKVVLDAWARKKGYANIWPTLPNGQKPDVLRTKGAFVFIGDAKNGENEGPHNAQTVSRLHGYVREFRALLATYKGGVIAVATNDETWAKQWVICLNVLAISEQLIDENENIPNFRVEKIDDSTWVTWW